MNDEFTGRVQGRRGPQARIDSLYDVPQVIDYLTNGTLPDDPSQAFSTCLAVAGYLRDQNRIDEMENILAVAAQKLPEIAYEGAASWVLSRGITFSCNLMGQVHDNGNVCNALQGIIVGAIGRYPQTERRGGYVAAFDATARHDCLLPFRHNLAVMIQDDVNAGMTWGKFGIQPLSEFLAERGLATHTTSVTPSQP